MRAQGVYLDNAATTPVDERVAAAMAACLERGGHFGNPSSKHRFGQAAARQIAIAREQVAQRVGASARSITFTSGATESDNLALQSVLLANPGRHLITAKTEHKAVLDTAAALARRGVAVTYLDCAADGLIDPKMLDAAFTAHTALVSIMHVNNETGVVQDIEALGERCRARGVLLHVDAAQSVGKLELNVTQWPVDLVSLTAHKVHGPKGVGALYLRPSLSLAPLLFGGEQEQSLRPGTLPTHQIVGMGAAYALADPAREGSVLESLKNRLWAGLSEIPDVRRNGHARHSAPHVLNVAFPGVNGESLRHAISEIAVSAGSACNADNPESSHVLSAMGLSPGLADSSLRFSVGRYTTVEEIDYVVGRVAAEVERLRRIAAGAPAWCKG